jgi:hypothetical protein
VIVTELISSGVKWLSVVFVMFSVHWSSPVCYNFFFVHTLCRRFACTATSVQLNISSPSSSFNCINMICSNKDLVRVEPKKNCGASYFVIFGLHCFSLGNLVQYCCFYFQTSVLQLLVT